MKITIIITIQGLDLAPGDSVHQLQRNKNDMAVGDLSVYSEGKDIK